MYTILKIAVKQFVGIIYIQNDFICSTSVSERSTTATWVETWWFSKIQVIQNHQLVVFFLYILQGFSTFICITHIDQQTSLESLHFAVCRSYCSRRIRRIRKSLHFPQGNKHKVQPKKITVEKLTDVRWESLETFSLLIPHAVLMPIVNHLKHYCS